MQIAGDRTVALLGERRRNPSRTIYVGWIRRSSFLEMFRCGLSLVHLSQMNALNMWNAATRDAIQGDAQDSRDFMVAEINVRAPAAAVPGHHIDVHFDRRQLTSRIIFDGFMDRNEYTLPEE